jgi:pimeloyl-ACP methyl ester carboxylesterase
LKVIAIDIQGNGEGDKPTDAAYYTTEKMCQDILVAAHACNVEKFSIGAFSYGANIGGYLAAQSTDVERFIITGTPFGWGAPGAMLH